MSLHCGCFADCLSRLCIDLTCKSFARNASFASGVNAPLEFRFWTRHSEWSCLTVDDREAPQLGAGVMSVTRVKEPVIGRCRARSCSSRLVLCTFSMARQRCLSHVRNVEPFMPQRTFCTSRVLIFLKPTLILFVKPYIVKTAFSWHCVSLLHNTSCNSV